MAGWRRAGAVAAVAAFVLALAGCNWFYQSNFPSYVPLIQNQVKVSDRFPYDPAGEFRVEVMNGGTGDYVIIFSAGPSIGERLAIYDENLDEKFFRDGGTAPVGFSFNAPAVIDDSGNLYVGLLAFGPGLAQLPDLTLNALSSPETLYETTVTFRSFQANGGNFLDMETTNDIETAGGPIALDVTGLGIENFERVDAAYDFEADVAGVVAFDSSGFAIHGVVQSATGISMSSPLSGMTGYFTFPVFDSYAQEISITADGVVIEHEEDGKLLAFYDFAGNRGDSVDISSRGDTAYAFSAAGTHFYLLLADEGKLIKANTWW
jgi:hypothetical protein